VAVPLWDRNALISRDCGGEREQNVWRFHIWTPVEMNPKDPIAFKVAHGDAKSNQISAFQDYGV